MKIPHHAIPLVVFAACAAAQTAPASPHFVSPPPSPVAPFDPKHPCALPAICDTFGASPTPELSFSLRPVEPSTLSATTMLVTPEMLTLPKTCYKLRAYEYTAVNPKTGQLRWTGMTTCQSSANFRMKSATLVVPR